MNERSMKHGHIDLTCPSRLVYRTLEGGVTEAGSDLRRVAVRSVGSASPALATLLARAWRVSPARLAHCLCRALAVLFDGLGKPQAMELALARWPARLGVAVSLARGRRLVNELAAAGALAVLEGR